MNEKKLIDSFYELSSIGCIYTDSKFNILCNCASCGFSCPMCGEHSGAVNSAASISNAFSVKKDECITHDLCITIHEHAAVQAERFGNTYNYFCPAGLMFSITRVLCGEEIRYLFAGPILATEHEDYLSDYLSGNPTSEITGFLSTLTYVTPKKINHSLDVLHAIVKSIESSYQYEKHNKVICGSDIQNQIGEYLQRIKLDTYNGHEDVISYPYEKEKQLVHAIVSANEVKAREYLNDILGHIFMTFSGDLQMLKIRAMELTVLISRASMDAGASMKNAHHMNMQYIVEFFNLDTIDDICTSLTEILHSYMENAFKMNAIKHGEILSQAIAYVGNNYMNKLTLEEVAREVFLSPSYLSRIFKEELQTNFSNFLNMIRIEKSKILMQSDRFSLVEISDLVGFIDQSYFNKVFKKITGVTPTKFRAQINNNIIMEE